MNIVLRWTESTSGHLIKIEENLEVEMYRAIKSVIIFWMVLLYSTFTGCMIKVIYTPNSCTIFTAEQDGVVLYGNNEDWHSKDVVLVIREGSRWEYGSVGFGYRDRDGQTNVNGLVNEKGLVWDVNSVPHAKMNPHPERPFSHEKDNYFSYISQHASTVEHAIAIAKRFDFGDSMEMQIHIADAKGDAVVIGPGPDGEIAFTRKDKGNGYLVSTNFSLATPDIGYNDFRYDKANEMLSNIMETGGLSPEVGGQILDAVHLNMLTSFTMYSNVMDTVNRKVYLYFMQQFDEVLVLDIKEEMAKGSRVVEMRELFSQETVEIGEKAYDRFEFKFTLVIVGVIAGGVALVALMIIKVIRRVSKKTTMKLSAYPAEI